MNLPKHAELLGSHSVKLEIKGEGAYANVRLTEEGKRKLLAGLSQTSGKTLLSRVYLILENIRGSLDATLLNIYLDLPKNVHADHHRASLAGTMSLYGLRMSSVTYGENAGLGLTSVFDITQRLIDLQVTSQLDGNEIRISILPDHPLPESSDIVVGVINIYLLLPE